jgi:Ca2+-binding RTX toxin-like protein
VKGTPGGRPVYQTDLIIEKTPIDRSLSFSGVDPTDRGNVWRLIFGGEGSQSAKDIRVTSDDEILVLGQTSPDDITGEMLRITDADLVSAGVPRKDFIAKINKNGDLLWQSNLSLGNEDRLLSFALDNKGGMYACGSTIIDGKDASILIVRIDQNGKILWRKTYDAGPNSSNVATKIESLASNRFAISGVTSGSIPGQQSNGGNDVFLITINASGDMIQGAQIGGSGDDNGADLSVDQDGYSYLSWTNEYGAPRISKLDTRSEITSTTSTTLTETQISLLLTGSDPINGTGNELDNTIIGNSGINILDGKEGSDKLRGQGSADIFLFSTKPSLDTATADHITDFSPTQGDKIQINRSAFGIRANSIVSLQTTTNSSNLKTALASSSLFVYNKSDGGFYWNQNGTAEGFGLGGIVAYLDNKTSLTASDISFVS